MLFLLFLLGVGFERIHMACTASSDCSKVTVPIPRLFPSLSSFTSARFTTPAMQNTSFSFFQPTLKSSCVRKQRPLFSIKLKNQEVTIKSCVDQCPHIGHKHCGAQPPGLQPMDDLGWDVGVVGDGGWDIHPTRPHVLSTTSLLTSHALQHTPGMFPIRVLLR